MHRVAAHVSANSRNREGRLWLALVDALTPQSRDAEAIAKAIQIEGPLSRLAIESRFVLARGYVNHHQVERAKQHTAALMAALRARRRRRDFRRAR
jgi:hypothetical protein